MAELAETVGGKVMAVVWTRSTRAAPWFGPAGGRVGPGGFGISLNYLNRFKLGK
jgi:hypothetical protein